VEFGGCCSWASVGPESTVTVHNRQLGVRTEKIAIASVLTVTRIHSGICNSSS